MTLNMPPSHVRRKCSAHMHRGSLRVVSPPLPSPLSLLPRTRVHEHLELHLFAARVVIEIPAHMHQCDTRPHTQGRTHTNATHRATHRATHTNATQCGRTKQHKKQTNTNRAVRTHETAHTSATDEAADKATRRRYAHARKGLRFHVGELRCRGAPCIITFVSCG